MSSAAVPSVKFYNGQTIPVLGLGTWKSKPGEVFEAVKSAIDIGYRHFDCAYLYGNEKEIGDAIREKIQNGDVTREELFITSKLWLTFFRSDLVEGAFMESLNNLGLKYLDLYLLHWPMAYKEGGELFPLGPNGKIIPSNADYIDAWKELEKLVNKGYIRSIGISNFNRRQTERLLEYAKIRPVCNQVECHPYLNQKKLKQYSEERGIKLVAYSPLGSPDRPWAQPGEPQLMDDPKIKDIASKYNKSPAQILIRYQIDSGNIVIPKSVNKKRIHENFQVLDFKLSQPDVQLIDTFNTNGRFLALENAYGHPEHPFENDEY